MNNQQPNLKPLLTIPILGGLIILGIWFFMPVNAQQVECATGQPLAYTFTEGSSWDLCWSLLDTEGVLLHQVHFTAPSDSRRQMLKEASVAQIIVSPDDGGAARHYLSERGLGGSHLITLTDAECPDGQLLVAAESTTEDSTLVGANVLCQQVVKRGFLYRYFDQQKQGEFLSLFSLSRVDHATLQSPALESKDISNEEGEQFYIIEWRFYDDGTIEPLVGDAGTESEVTNTIETGTIFTGTVPSGYVTDVFWRLDIDIGQDGDDDIVEEIEMADIDEGTRQGIVVSTIVTETARSVAPDIMRSWRVRAGTLANSDGHLVSYQLEARNIGHHYKGDENELWSQHQLYVTALDPCERLATGNSSSDECGADISQFADGESLEGRDVVFWYRASAHRTSRFEDTPVKNVAWMSFHLVPRDWTAVNPFTQQ